MIGMSTYASMPGRKVGAPTQPNSDKHTYRGVHHTWLLKAKSDAARVKFFQGPVKRYFTIDFEQQILYYSHSESNKKISLPIAFRDILGAELLPREVQLAPPQTSAGPGPAILLGGLRRSLSSGALRASGIAAPGSSDSYFYPILLSTRERKIKLSSQIEWEASRWASMLHAAHTIGKRSNCRKDLHPQEVSANTCSIASLQARSESPAGSTGGSRLSEASLSTTEGPTESSTGRSSPAGSEVSSAQAQQQAAGIAHDHTDADSIALCFTQRSRQDGPQEGFVSRSFGGTPDSTPPRRSPVLQVANEGAACTEKGMWLEGAACTEKGMWLEAGGGGSPLHLDPLQEAASQSQLNLSEAEAGSVSAPTSDEVPRTFLKAACKPRVLTAADFGFEDSPGNSPVSSPRSAASEILDATRDVQLEGAYLRPQQAAETLDENDSDTEFAWCTASEEARSDRIALDMKLVSGRIPHRDAREMDSQKQRKGKQCKKNIQVSAEQTAAARIAADLRLLSR
eukprot:gnl/TRDRNA2_/TRDRNA2_154371_c0_seq3.p1 gnl/TRDRNA2_/TRDRNA2_154371_c0~~gnl/TRDRNA2_/TRDRNA2_154371_c0_seq3.p1  ORF type:complete len:512 (-),score=79.86 gnl/TRDRNA2_/TRDRNA2_154371_c0_seq3:46-1581(-)